MTLNCLLGHSEYAEYAFLKIVSLQSYFCRYVYRCAKSCFASFVTKVRSISSIYLIHPNSCQVLSTESKSLSENKAFVVHTIFYKNTINRDEPQVLFSLNPQTLTFFLFQCLYLFKKLFL